MKSNVASCKDSVKPVTQKVEVSLATGNIFFKTACGKFIINTREMPKKLV